MKKVLCWHPTEPVLILKPLTTEPSLEHPDYFPPPKRKTNWDDMEIPPELQSLHEDEMRKFFSREKHLEDSLKEQEDNH